MVRWMWERLKVSSDQKRLHRNLGRQDGCQGPVVLTDTKAQCVVLLMFSFSLDWTQNVITETQS